MPHLVPPLSVLPAVASRLRIGEDGPRGRRNLLEVEELELEALELEELELEALELEELELEELELEALDAVDSRGVVDRLCVHSLSEAAYSQPVD